MIKRRKEQTILRRFREISNEKKYDYDGELKFEGEYKNGEKDGKGKEYDDDILRFEGEYLKGERNGKGKEYDNGKLEFEGEYLNGEKWNGKGKEYYSDGKLKFGADYLNGERIIINSN